MQITTEKIDRCRRILDEMLPPEMIGGACLYHAIVAQRVIGGRIVAGSMQWKFTHYDDGKNSTHFAYMFETQNLHIKLANSLSEMHVWNVIDDRVLDLSTKYFPQQAKKLGAVDAWAASLIPPDYYFGKPIADDNLCRYVEHEIATALIAELVARFGEEIYKIDRFIEATK